MLYRRSMNASTRFETMSRRLSLLLILIATCNVPAPLLLAQTGSASVLGRVTDQRDAIISDANIQIKNVDTGFTANVMSNGDGQYLIPFLNPGNYVMIVGKQGFQTVTLTGITLNTQDNLSRNFTLQVGAVSESVTVYGTSSNVNTTDASVSTVVDRNFVENMPLNGRSFQSLIELTPGVLTVEPGGASLGQFSVNGQRPDTNYFSIDGVSANVGISQGTYTNFGSAGAGAVPPVTAGGGMNNLVSIDALQEFKIQTSTFAPEFGRTPGAQVSFVTRSGTNQFHATTFEYFRNSVLDARDWFTNYNDLPKPEERQNDFGGVLGGPILKNRLFFFFSYEGLRLRQPFSKSEVVPSTTARNQASPSLQPLLNAFPLPTESNGPLTGVFSASYSNPSALDATSIRVDYALSSKFSVFGRYDHAPSSENSRGAYDFFALSTLSNTVSDVDTVTAGVTGAFTPTVVNEFRFNYSRTTGGTVNVADDFGGAVVPPESYLYPGNPQANSSNAAFGAYLSPTTNGWSVGQNRLQHQRQLNFVDMASWTVGPHHLKAGVDYRRLAPTNILPSYFVGYIFSGLTGALSGTTSLAAVQSVDTAQVHPVFQNLSWFVQDIWGVMPNLTITYGLRWEYNPPPSATSAYPLYTATDLNDPANAALAPGGTPLWNATHDNFAPRLGIAYLLNPAPGHEMVLRAGAGTFYDLGNNSGANGALGFPYSRTAIFLNTSYPVSAAEAAPVPFTLNPPYGTMDAFDPHLKLPRVYQWNVSLQQSIGSNQTVTVTYVGAAGRKLLRDEGIVAADGLNPNFAGIDVTTNDGRSNYDALQLQYQRRLSHGLQVLASYAWGHSLDNASAQGAASPYRSVYNPDTDYGDSDFDVRHSFSTAITYNIPFRRQPGILRALTGNWSVDSLFRANSAPPINVVTGLDPFGLDLFAGLDLSARPNVVAGQPQYLYGSGYPGGKRINPAAFVNPAAGQQGDLGRNVLRGFGAWEEDLAIRREFPLYEQMRLQFRAEFFNIFNHPNFGNPGSGDTQTSYTNNPLFGLSTQSLAQGLSAGSGSNSLSPLYQVGGPRSIQLALKLVF